MTRHGASLYIGGARGRSGVARRRGRAPRARDAVSGAAAVRERLLYLQSGKTADRLMLSFDALAADVYWIRTIQHYGRDQEVARARPAASSCSSRSSI